MQVLSPAELLKQQVEAQQQMLRLQQEQLEQQHQQIEALRQQRAREEEAEERRRARESVLAARGRRQTLSNPALPNSSSTGPLSQVGAGVGAHIGCRVPPAPCTTYRRLHTHFAKRCIRRGCGHFVPVRVMICSCFWQNDVDDKVTSLSAYPQMLPTRVSSSENKRPEVNIPLL
jgi:hypothetical protein